MIARVLLVLAIVAPRAEASHCHEVSDVVGYEHCSVFGSGWTPASLHWDLGIAMLGMSPGHIDQNVTIKDPMTVVHVESFGDPRVVAFGPRLHTQFQLGGPFFVGNEMTVAFVERGPLLLTSTAARGSQPNDTSGFATTGLVVAGLETAAGRWFVGTELGAGWRGVMLTTAAIPHGSGPVDIEPAVELRVRGGAFVNHWLSIQVAAGSDLIDRSAYSIGIAVGLHLVAWDGLR